MVAEYTRKSTSRCRGIFRFASRMRLDGLRNVTFAAVGEVHSLALTKAMYLLLVLLLSSQ